MIVYSEWKHDEVFEGTAENGNTIVWYGADTDPVTLQQKTPATFTLVEADASPEAKALAVLNTSNSGAYRALPVDTLFGEVYGNYQLNGSSDMRLTAGLAAFCPTDGFRHFRRLR